MKINISIDNVSKEKFNKNYEDFFKAVMSFTKLGNLSSINLSFITDGFPFSESKDWGDNPFQE